MLGMPQCRQLAGLYLRGGLFFSLSSLLNQRQRLDGSQVVAFTVQDAPAWSTVGAENRPTIGMYPFFYSCHEVNFVVRSSMVKSSFYQVSDFNPIGHIVVPCASGVEQLCRCRCRFRAWIYSCAFLLPGGSRQRVQSGFVPHVSSYL